MANTPTPANSLNPQAQAPNPLVQLRDIHLPEPISWWPPAPGWWFLAVASGVLLAWALKYLHSRYRANHYRRQALVRLQQLRLQEPDREPQEQIRALFVLLKQTANCAYPNRQPSSLAIQAFVSFLCFSCDRSVFTQSKLELESLLYAQQTDEQSADIDSLFEDARIWIKDHTTEDKLEVGDPC
jgi:hypothetical protein